MGQDVTEVEAKKLQCPATFSGDTGKCVTTRCAAWRWAETWHPDSYIYGYGTGIGSGRPTPSASGSFEISTTHGHCGLAR